MKKTTTKRRQKSASASASAVQRYDVPPKANDLDATIELSDQGMSELLFAEVKESIEYRESVLPKIPVVYLQDVYRTLQRQNNQCKDFINRWYPFLRESGFKPHEARKILEADCFKCGWRPRTCLQYWPNEAKDTFHSEIGRKGGKAKAYSLMLIEQKENEKQHVGLHNADQETRERVSSSGGLGKTPEQQAEAGHKGGNAVKERYGKEQFGEMGTLAAEHSEDEIELVPELENIDEDKKYVSNIVRAEELMDIAMKATDSKYEYIDIRTDPQTGKILTFYSFNKQTKTNAA